MLLILALTLYITAASHATHSEETQISKKIPSFIKICHKRDPNLNECIKSSVNHVKPYLKHGIPALHIPPCEPLFLPEIVIDQGKGSVTVKSKYTNVKIYGPTNFHLLSVIVDLDTDRVKVKLRIPKLEMTSNYTISGRILMLPIAGTGTAKGNYYYKKALIITSDYTISGRIRMLPVAGTGTAKGNYSNIEATAMMIGEKYMKNGKEHIKVKDFFVDFKIGNASVYLSNLFDGDQQLGKAMNDFLNENWRNVAEEMKPVIEKTIGGLIKEFSNRIYSKYPLEELLPP